MEVVFKKCIHSLLSPLSLLTESGPTCSLIVRLVFNQPLTSPKRLMFKKSEMLILFKGLFVKRGTIAEAHFIDAFFK